VARIGTAPGVTVLDASSPSMLLVEGPAAEVASEVYWIGRTMQDG
jgi:hypothetical protein